LSACIANKLEGNLVQVGKLRIPVAVETGHLHPIAAHPFDKPERSGAHRVGLGAFVSHHGQHDGITFCHVGDKERIHIFEGDDQGGVVRGYHLGDPAEVFRMGIDGFFIHGAFQVPFGCGSIEVLAIVKFDAGTQVKSVSQSIARNKPGNSQPRDKRPIAADLDKPLVNVGENNAIDGRSRVPGGIQSRGFGRLTHH